VMVTRTDEQTPTIDGHVCHKRGCGKPATHDDTRNGIRRLRCCQCYVQDGNPPFDLHPDCVKAAKDMKDKSDAEKKKLQTEEWEYDTVSKPADDGNDPDHQPDDDPDDDGGDAGDGGGE
jgi:hypothetical protein